jgi:predicted nucleotide-binding protein
VSNESDDVFTKMGEMVERAVASFQLQNPRDADMAAHTAEALYVTSKNRLAPGELSILGMFRDATLMFAPLTHTIVLQSEGRFAKARVELAKGARIADKALATIDEYTQLPDPDLGVIDIWRPILSVFPIIFKGYDAYIRAEIVGYQGNIPEYRKLLIEAVEAYRQINQVPTSPNPMFLSLVGLCVTVANNLENRAEVFGSLPRQRYMIPTGDKVFIIHGHDEGKWRELRELLEDRFKLTTIVLKEEPGAGETLIRKFEEYADDCCYAFALLTPDDLIGKKGKRYAQARPNVLFELGWFYGHFGRSRVCIVKKDTTEIPSDLAGITTVDFKTDVDEGLIAIEEELERAGIFKPGGRE